jgi:DNA helicase-2/ATP-dependent DNA helicase PcrA
MDWMDVRAVGSGGAEPRRAEEPGHAPVEDLLDGLNEPQRAACEHGDGSLLILAGPGSGKTRVITHRIAHLVTRCGVRPDEVLAITFTNKAAREMRERVERLLPDARGLWISTFHALCARLLRREIGVLPGYSRDFTIYDTSDKNQLLKGLVKELGYDAKRFRPGAIGGWISNVKNGVEDEPDGLTGGMEGDVFLKVRALYEQRLRENNALDFDDLLLRVLEIFDEHPGVRDQYARRFRHVMVDEYQDTNRVQYLLTRHLASFHGNLAVCGDPDQSIYRWRGADIRNILDFEEDFGAPVTIKLEQNYRSTGRILAAASALIGHNSQRKPKDLWTAGEDGELLVSIECGDEDDEAREIAAQARTLHARGRRWSEIAILYRMNFMQRALESALRLAQVPYQIVGGLEFYARREIRDLVAYLRLAVNPRDDVACARVVNVPLRGIGQTSLAKLAAWAQERSVPLSDAVRSAEALAGIRGRAKRGLTEFAASLVRLSELRDADAGVAFEALLAELDVERWLAEMDDGRGLVDREANVEELRAHAHGYDRLHPAGKLPGFLEDVALVSDIDGLEDGEDKVTLMTLHACKGLEFPYVFITGLEEELLPHARALQDDPLGGLEEERRLLYVGMTRAKERLFLTNAKTRRYFGEERWMRPSAFLEEIPASLVEGQEDERDEASVLGAYEPSGAHAAPALAVGDRVEHDHFGAGTITRLSGSGVNARAFVDFVHHGSKQLLLQYAKLRKRG